LIFQKAAFRCHQTQLHSAKCHRNAAAAADPPRTPLEELTALRRPPNCKELWKEKNEENWKTKKAKMMVGNEMSGVERVKRGQEKKFGPFITKS